MKVFYCHYLFICICISPKLRGCKRCMESSIVVAEIGQNEAPAENSRRLLFWSSCWNIDDNFALVLSNGWNLLCDHYLCCWDGPCGEIHWENLNSSIFNDAQKQLKSSGCQCSLIRDYKGGTIQTFSGVQKGVGLFSHARDNIYISRQLWKDFPVLACFSPLCHFPFTIARKKIRNIWAQTKTHHYVHNSLSLSNVRL